ncbi:FMRFamide receptor-like [Argiope bruennichi]|uniref:FMRFamide receptor like protein n=1 Tax=Argiope bruennichi TaxID=94029 RepID=A0A8T0E922_ARGBR|nr:FMRFamide receptor-like [Argiope bruennichi]XP_055935918.1 FMRFamide receptor-like [Argiope bruennichi]XP_055935919.1 FMRFamide receptor-like [Argiope bruennichi]KAF8768339.1 FMRFamide receptor like protein [Argiope bruennichi]
MNVSESSLTAEEAGDIEFHKNFLLTTRFWVQRILVPSIMTIGIVGNVVTIVIMTRRRMRSSTNNYLAALAIFDMMYLIFTFILSLSHYPRIPDSDHFVYWRLKPFILMLTDTCSNTSVWLTVTFTVERYIAVCHPMKGKVFCTESRAKKAIVAVFLFCFAFTIPTPFEWKVIERTDQTTNHTTLALDHSEMGKNYLYKTIYYWLTVVFFIFVPFILLAIFNSFLIRSVHLSKVQRSSMTRGENSDNSQENKITIMLIAVVILFFICQLPTACHLLYSTLHENFDLKQLYLLRGLGNIFNFLMSLNAAGNFVLYCLLSQKYRRTFIQIFCPCLREKRGMMNSMYYQSTVCSNVDTDSPGSSSSRRLSNARISKLGTPRGSSGDVDHARKDSPAGGSRTVFLQVPKCSASKVVYEDDDDAFTEDSSQGQTSCAGRCRKMLRGPWRHLKQSMGIEDKKTREQVIPLKGGGNKCIVITAPDGIPDSSSHWTPNSAV